MGEARVIIIGYLSCSDPGSVAYPEHISRDTGIDAVLSFFGTLLPPANDACEEPCVLITGSMGSTAVALAGILAYSIVSSTEHEFGNGVSAATFALCPVHIGNLHLLEGVGFDPSKFQPSPAAHQRVLCALKQVLCEVFGAQADGQGVI